MRIAGLILSLMMLVSPISLTEWETIGETDAQFGASEQAKILIENDGEYDICICELYSTTFGYQYTLNIWTERTNEWCKHKGNEK